MILAGLLLLPLFAEEIPTFRTEVALVRVDAQVTTPQGADIGSLRQQDFVIYDEGERQHVLHFGRESDPLDVVLLVDVSGSMWQHLRGLSSTTAAALGQLRPGDRAALIAFGTKAEVAEPLTTEFREVERRLVGTMFKQTLGRGTLLNQALVFSAEYLRKHSPKNARRAILVITDNLGERGSVSDEAAAESISAADAVLNAIVVGTSEERAVWEGDRSALPDIERLASQSGGTAVRSDHVADALSRTIAQLRTRYSLQYSAPPGAQPGSTRRIRVELAPAAKRSHPGAVVRARESYAVAPAGE